MVVEGVVWSKLLMKHLNDVGEGWRVGQSAVFVLPCSSLSLPSFTSAAVGESGPKVVTPIPVELPSLRLARSVVGCFQHVAPRSRRGPSEEGGGEEEERSVTVSTLLPR